MPPLPSRSETSFGIFAGIGAALIWGAWPVFSRDAVIAGFSSFDIALLRFGTAGLILAPFLLKNGFGGLQPLRAIALAIGAGTPYVLVTANGLSMAPAGHGGVIIPCAMLSTSTIGAWVFLREKPNALRLLGLAVIFIGIVLTAWSAVEFGLDFPAMDALLGDGLFILGGMLWATYTICCRAWAVEPFQATAVVSVLSMAAILPLWLLTDPDRILQAPLGALAWQAGFQGILAAIGALVFYTKAVAVFGAARGALFAILGPVFTILLAMPVLGEIPSPVQIAGLVLCLFGMAVAFGGHDLAAKVLRKYTLSKPSSVRRSVSS